MQHVKYIFMLCLVILVYSNSRAQIINQKELADEFSGQMKFVESRLIQLAEAVPAEKYNWRPADAVRSIGEVYLHAAFGNYIFIKMSGGTVPDSVNFDFDSKKWDTQTTDKSKIIDILKTSFALALDRIKSFTDEDLNKKIKVFGSESTVRNFTISMIAHTHEHLGQSIAYARANSIVPPWSKSSK